MGLLKMLFLRHAYSVMFGWVLVEQAGVPIPSVPLMLAAGTMSAAHKVHVAFMLPLVLLACLLADSMWYWLGRRYGGRVLDLICKLSLDATTCVNRAQGSMARRGGVTLLFAKFVPGVSTIAAPIAGQSGMGYPAFAAYDMTGTFIWAASWLLVGRFFGDLARRSSQLFATLTRFAAGLVLLMIVGMIVYRYVQRRRFLAELRGLRLEPDQLLAMLDEAQRRGAEPPFIIDLRHPLDVLTDPMVVPGALRIGPDELRRHREEIPNDREIVLYCTCPSEETSAKVAMELRRLGVSRVRPLRGGLQGWKDAGYPLESVLVSPSIHVA
ncbi:MAG TPA: VTT domain-containing protein [Acidobacteriaceae bacterium]|jgi:membrane protein DedA with SNARE-associated domain/rhodanese-related sulfurtransferase